MDFFNIGEQSISEIKIGKGAFGNVYLVEDQETKIKYAVKKIERQDSITNLESIMREIDALIQCKYPTIVKFYGSS